MAVNKLLQEEKEDKQKEKKQLYFIFAGCIVLLLLVVSGILRMQRSKQLKRKPSGRTDTGKYAAEKAAERFCRSADTTGRNQQSFFLAQFKETYPDFIERLLAHEPDLSEYDLKLSANIRLGLSTKQIAQYEIIALRTAESRKYRLKRN